MINDITELEREDVFAFLEDLKASGSIDMGAAIPYIQEEFDCNQRIAKSLYLRWSKT